jgi:uncharacterized membrane protein YoaK (UPF0700 family)
MSNNKEKLLLLEQQTPTPNPTPEKPVNERNDFKWILLGSSGLSFCAGFVNVISILSVLSSTVSHNTGIASKMAINFGRLHWAAFWYQFAILIAYVFGSMFVGAFIKREKFHYSRGYGLMLIIESIALTIATSLYKRNHGSAVVIASWSMGLQNALFTNFSGAVVRTTHVTGLLTDIGIHFGHVLRWRKKTKEFWRVKVLLSLLAGFLIGGLFGTIFFDMFGVGSIYIPAAILFIGGVIWTVWRLKYQRSLASHNYSSYDKF